MGTPKIETKINNKNRDFFFFDLILSPNIEEKIFPRIINTLFLLIILV